MICRYREHPNFFEMFRDCVPPDFAQKRFHITRGRDYYKQFLVVGELGITVMAFDFDSIVYETV